MLQGWICGCCSASKGARLVAWILSFLIWWIYAAMDLLDWPQVEIVQL